MKELCPQFAGFVKLNVSFFCVSNLSPEDCVLRLVETRIDPGTFLKGERIRFEEVRDHNRRTACRNSGMHPVQAILEEVGLTMGNVVKTTVFMADMNDFADMNAVYAEFFSEPYPARSAVAVKTLPKGALVEIEVVAAV